MKKVTLNIFHIVYSFIFTICFMLDWVECIQSQCQDHWVQSRHGSWIGCQSITGHQAHTHSNPCAIHIMAWFWKDGENQRSWMKPMQILLTDNNLRPESGQGPWCCNKTCNVYKCVNLAFALLWQRQMQMQKLNQLKLSNSSGSSQNTSRHTKTLN